MEEVLIESLALRNKSALQQTLFRLCRDSAERIFKPLKTPPNWGIAYFVAPRY
jgi:hypothetical protein